MSPSSSPTGSTSSATDPILSTPIVILLSSLLTLLYLSSIYLHSSTRIKPNGTTRARTPQDRNSPSVIKSRLAGVSLSTLFSLVVLPFLLPSNFQLSTRHLFGIALPSSIVQTLALLLVPLGVTATLFLGPLYVVYLRKSLPGQANFLGWRTQVLEEFGLIDYPTRWEGIRNYWIGPITEELVFRSCIVSLALLNGQSSARIISTSPMYFGLAHIHHAYETYVMGGRTLQSLKLGIIRSVFQFGYTSLFGAYATFLFLRTGSILPPILSHTFCNYMGLPPLFWSLQSFPHHKKSIWFVYVLGVVGFVLGIRGMDKEFFR